MINAFLCDDLQYCSMRCLAVPYSVLRYSAMLFAALTKNLLHG